ncbi:MAG: cyclase family protein, partial [Stellaceae bacterium]
MPKNPRWKRRPPGSTWGDWGPDDQLGRLNLLTPDKVLKGVAEVKEGRTFCLSLPLDYPGGTVVNPRRHPPRLIANKRNGMPYIAYPLAREDPKLIDVVCDDIV